MIWLDRRRFIDSALFFLHLFKEMSLSLKNNLYICCIIIKTKQSL